VKINRNNYEPYLLDYSEGRLSPEEGREIALFLELNADIMAEFHAMCGQISLPEEVIAVPDFSFLKQPIEPTEVFNPDTVEQLAHPVNTAEAEELPQRLKLLYPQLSKDIDYLQLAKLTPQQPGQFLNVEKTWAEDISPVDALLVMAAEGDLNQVQMRAINDFSNVELQSQLNMLSATKLRPDLISCPGKSALYQTPVVILWHQQTWLRVAAAVLLLLGVWTFLPNNQEDLGIEAQMAQIRTDFLEATNGKIEPETKPTGQVVSQSDLKLPVAAASSEKIDFTKEPAPDFITFKGPQLAENTVNSQLLLSSGSMLTVFETWTESVTENPGSQPGSSRAWEQLASRGVENLLGLDRQPNQSLTAAVFSKATDKLNERDNMQIQIAGSKPDKQLAGWKVRIGQLQIAKRDR